jgi:SAM-dependent methyltransferase
MSEPAGITLPRTEVDLEARCPSCGHTGLSIFHEQSGVPIHSCRLVATREEADRFPRGDIRLGFCGSCGFITNTAYDPAVQDYSISYEETQGFSPRFQDFMRELAQRLIDRHGVHDKDVFEIGCGKGEFLVLMCELGDNRGVGIDPSFVAERIDSPAASRIRFIRDLYSERYADLTGDFVACRHTLEHIHDTGSLMRLLRRTLGDRRNVVVFFELPETMRVLREPAFWDIYYEHCSYFTPGSLARLFRHTGFEVTALELDYDDQYILLDARPDGSAQPPTFELEETPEEVARAIEDFRVAFAQTTEQWMRRLTDARAAGSRVVLWGSGSKGVSFLTTLGIRDEVELVVDINPFKQGKYMAGTGQLIVAPDRLADYRPDLVVAMNPIYLDEIQADLDRLGVDAELLAV